MLYVAFSSAFDLVKQKWEIKEFGKQILGSLRRSVPKWRWYQSKIKNLGTKEDLKSKEN